MPKSLVEEAIADAQGLKQLAEDRAKRAVLEMVTPRLKHLIDSTLLGEAHDVAVEAESASEVTSKGGEFVMSNESIKALAPVLRSSSNAASLLVAEVATLGESVARACSKGVSGDVIKLLARIEHTYFRVRESVSLGPKKKDHLCSKLEGLNSELNESFKEIIEMRDKKNLREADEMPGAGEDPAMDPSAASSEPSAETAQEGEDVVITLKGLKDVDAESLNVDVKVDTEEEEAGEEGGEGEEGTDDLFGGEESAAAPPAASKMESRKRSDREIVFEISQADLKREMKRMRINEADSDVGNKMPKGGKIPVDDFGGGHDDGDPWLDHDVTVAEGVEDMNEEEEEMQEEGEDMDESDGDLGVTETQLRRREDTFGSKLANGHDTMVEFALSEEEDMNEEEEMKEEEEMAYENLKRQYFSVRKVHTESSKKLENLKVGVKKYAGTPKGSQYRKAALQENGRVKHYGEKLKKLSEQLRKASASLKEGSKKSVPSTQNTKQIAALKLELAKTQLENRKILCATKLLQTEGMTSAKKNAIIDALDATRSLQEVNAVYSKLAKKLASGKQGTMNESVDKTGSTRGSASRAGKTSGSSQTLNESADPESIETNRWAVLAGLPSQK